MSCLHMFKEIATHFFSPFSLSVMISKTERYSKPWDAAGGAFTGSGFCNGVS